MWQYSSLFSFCLCLLHQKITFLRALFLGSSWHCTDYYWTPVVSLLKSPLIKKHFPTPAVFLSFPPSFSSCGANEQRTNKGTNLTSNTPLLRLLVNFGLHKIIALLRWPKPTSQFYTTDGRDYFRMFVSCFKFFLFRVAKVGSWQRGRVHSFGPWVLHSRQSWQEWMLGEKRGGDDLERDQILGTIFHWLIGSQSHCDYQTRLGQIRGGQIIHHHLLWLPKMAESVDEHFADVLSIAGKGPSLFTLLLLQMFGQYKNWSVLLSFLCLFVQSRRLCPFQFFKCSRAATNILKLSPVSFQHL